MAFLVRNIAVIGYANGFTLWHYRSTGDTLDAIVSPGYFEPARDLFALGDMLIVNSVNGSAILVVSDIAGPVMARLAG
jgi:hypothetical protein